MVQFWKIIDSGVLNITYNGEIFNGQNGNNKIKATGNKGSQLTCSYSMPAQEGLGTCQLNNQTLKMKFN